MGFSARTSFGPDPSRPCPFCHNLWVPVCVVPTVFRRPCFLGILHPLWLSQPFSLLFFRVPWAPRGRNLIETSHLGWNVQGRSLSAHFLAVGFCVTPICCRKTLLWWWLSKILIYEYGNGENGTPVGPLLSSNEASSSKNGLHLVELLAEGTLWQSANTPTPLLRLLSYFPQTDNKALMLKTTPTQLLEHREDKLMPM